MTQILTIKKLWQRERRKLQNSLPKDEEGTQWLQLKVLPTSTNSSLRWSQAKPESWNAQQKEQLLPEESNARCGRQDLIATVGQRAVALLWLYFHSDSNMCGGTTRGHLSLCCKDSLGISCVATSERILLSLQKQKTLPYGCFTINQDTYQCFCCLMLTTPQSFLRPQYNENI